MDFDAILFKSGDLNYLELFIRTTILYFTLFFSAKAMGYRQPGNMTPYNFIMAAGVSHIAAARMVNPAARPLDAVVIIFLYTILNLILSYIYLKKYSLVAQETLVLIKNGKINKNNLSKINLTLENLLSALRSKNAFSVKNVDYAIAEATGDISVLKNPNHLPPYKYLLNIQNTPQTLPEILIYQGKVASNVLAKNSLDYNWLKIELDKNNITNPEEIFLGILESDKTLYIG